MKMFGVFVKLISINIKNVYNSREHSEEVRPLNNEQQLRLKNVAARYFIARKALILSSMEY